jgi:hypothetical protein
LGQHTFECLREAGVDESLLVRLAATGVIKQSAPAF